METSDKKIKKQLEQELISSLKKGAFLYLDGELSSPKKVCSTVLREESSYMADYVTDDHGLIKEIRFDNICKY